MEDNQILNLLLARDEQGLIELEQKYGTKLKHLTMGILPEEDALECLNDTYLAEWNKVAKRNATIVELSAELEQCIPDTSSNMDRQELGELISSFLNTLSIEKRALFVRRYWYGESIRELSNAFGYRESKIKSILFRLRNQLGKELHKEGFL